MELFTYVLLFAIENGKMYCDVFSYAVGFIHLRKMEPAFISILDEKNGRRGESSDGTCDGCSDKNLKDASIEEINWLRTTRKVRVLTPMEETEKRWNELDDILISSWLATLA